MVKIGSPSLRLMGNRLMIFEDINKKPEDKNTLDGISSHALRLRSNGGFIQQDRMIFDKRRSLDRALLYSYQSALIKKVQCDVEMNNMEVSPIHDLDVHPVCRALINPDKLKMDYDEKILSVHWEENFHAGDVFEWVGTNSYWLIYLQDLDEKAYFRSKIRRCSYEIEWEDEEGRHKSYAAVRGPVETKIDYIQKHGISVDNPNHSLNIYLPKSKDTLEYFRRYAKFYLQGEDEGSPQVCWRVEATDWISTPGVLEITAVEYYINETEDDLEEGIVGGLIVKPTSPNEPETDYYIDGDVFIKPNQVYEYFFTGLENSSWSVTSCSKAPVKFNVNPNNPKHIKLKWESTYSGQFVLKYGEYEKTIVVESLF